MKIKLTKKLFATFLLFHFLCTYSLGQVEISGTTDVCQFTSVKYTATNVPDGASGFGWDATGGTFTSSTTTSFTVAWGSNGSGSVTFVYTLDKANYSVDLDVEIIGPTGYIGVTSTPQIICEGESSTLVATVSNSKGDFEYVWDSGEKENTIEVFPTSIGSNFYGVTATDQCSNVIHGTGEVVVRENPIITLVTDNTLICPGATTTLQASGATYYSWSPPNGLSSTTADIVQARPLVTTTYTVSGNDGFCQADSKSVTIQVQPSVNVSATKTSICPGQSTTLTASYSSGTPTSYSWSPATGLNTTTGSSVIASPTTTTTYTVTGVLNGCTTTTSIPVYVLTIPVVPTIAGPTDYCLNPPNQTFNVPIGNTPDGDDGSKPVYTWSLSNSTLGTFVGSNIGKTSTVDFSNIFTGAATLYLQVSNQCGAATGSLPINIYPGIAAAPTGITGPTTVCSSTNPTSAFSLPQMTANTVWETSPTTPTNAITSSTTNPYGVYTVTWNPAFSGTANIRVKIQNACGSSAWSSYFPVNVFNSVPSNPYTVHGPVGPNGYICPLAGNSLFSLGQNVSNVVWSVSPSTAYTSTSTSSSTGQLTVVWNTTFVGIVTVKAKTQNACGSSAWTPDFNVSVGKTNAIIYGPTNACNQSTTTSNYSLGAMTAGLVWTFTTGSVKSYFINPGTSCQVTWSPTFTDKATVNVAIPNGCSGSKDVTISNGTCAPSRLGDGNGALTTEPVVNLSASLYPNPSNGSTNLLITSPENSTVEIFDSKGVKVYSKDQVVSGIELSIGGDLPEGIYTVLVVSNNDLKTLRFVKLD